MLLTSIGSAIIFNCDASSGGTDIVALILKKFTSIDVGKALLAVDFVVAASAFAVFGIQSGLFSLLGLFAKAFIVDAVIESLNTCKLREFHPYMHNGINTIVCCYRLFKAVLKNLVSKLFSLFIIHETGCLIWHMKLILKM